MLGKNEDKRRRGRQRIRRLDRITNSMDVNLSKLPEIVEDRGARGAPGKSGLHASGEGERLIALEPW